MLVRCDTGRPKSQGGWRIAKKIRLHRLLILRNLATALLTNNPTTAVFIFGSIPALQSQPLATGPSQPDTSFCPPLPPPSCKGGNRIPPAPLVSTLFPAPPPPLPFGPRGRLFPLPLPGFESAGRLPPPLPLCSFCQAAAGFPAGGLGPCFRPTPGSTIGMLRFIIAADCGSSPPFRGAETLRFPFAEVLRLPCLPLGLETAPRLDPGWLRLLRGVFLLPDVGETVRDRAALPPGGDRADEGGDRRPPPVLWSAIANDRSSSLASRLGSGARLPLFRLAPGPGPPRLLDVRGAASRFTPRRAAFSCRRARQRGIFSIGSRNQPPGCVNLCDECARAVPSCEGGGKTTLPAHLSEGWKGGSTAVL